MARIVALTALAMQAHALPAFNGRLVAREELVDDMMADSSLTTAHQGRLLYAFQNNNAGACGIVHRDEELIIGIHSKLYGDASMVSSLCGSVVTINSKDGRSLHATVADVCLGPNCGDTFDIVGSTAVYDKLGGDRDAGILDVSWSFLPSCGQTGVARFGYQNNTVGSCGTIHQDDDLIAAIRSDVKTTKCGDTLIVTNRFTGALLEVIVADTFTAGEESDLVLSTATFDKIGGVRDTGLLPISWIAKGASDCKPVNPVASASDPEDRPAHDKAEMPQLHEPIIQLPAVQPPASPLPSDAPQLPVVESPSEPPSEASSAPSPAPAPHEAPHTPTPATPAPAPSPPSPAPAPAPGQGEGYALVSTWAGESFFDNFDFAIGPADNQGAANYVGRESGLAFVAQDGVAIMAVDSTPNVRGAGLRNSVKIVSKSTFTRGLMIYDIKKMPTGCGTWPAAWMTGPNWPFNGEVDVLEGANMHTRNMQSIHTGPGCSIDQGTADWLSTKSEIGLAGPAGLECNSFESNNEGCAFRDRSPLTFGSGLNSAGGAVIAVRIDEAGVFFWTFPRSRGVPADIDAGNPSPSIWGMPSAAYPSSGCPTETHFRDLKVVINTNLAGIWSSGVWHFDEAYAGQVGGSCATTTGKASAWDYVVENGEAFANDAVWQINSIKTYDR